MDAQAVCRCNAATLQWSGMHAGMKTCSDRTAVNSNTHQQSDIGSRALRAPQQRARHPGRPAERC